MTEVKLSDDGWTNTVHVPIEWRPSSRGNRSWRLQVRRPNGRLIGAENAGILVN